jgi:type I restriction system adenine methylase HsdM
MDNYNLKSIKENFKKQGIFYTPQELAEFMKSLIDIQMDEVYDPTCGRGSLLSVFDDSVKKYGQDVNESEVHVARESLKNFNGAVGDTLIEPAFADKKFKAIVANPPFSIAWTPPTGHDPRFADCPAIPPKGKADYAFILHIIHYLKNDGIAVVLNFPGILYRGNREGQIRQWMIENNYIEKVISIPGDTFVDTKIETCVLVLKKNKQDKSVLFVNTKHQLSRSVDVSEIEKNDFCLTINRYVAPEVEKETYDMIELEKQARKNMISRLDAELKFSKFISEMQGTSFSELITEIKQLISNYEDKNQGG